MSLSSLTYARARLYLGITTVGFWVLAALVVLWQRPTLSLASALISLALARVFLSLPFDVLGGYVLPARFGRLPAELTPKRFAWAWLRGALAQALLISAFLCCLYKVAGTVEKTLLFLSLQLCLYRFQEPLARLVADLPRVAANADRLAALTAHPALQGKALPNMVFVRATDPGFVGGWSERSLLLPAHWLHSLPTDALAMQLLRRTFVQTSGARIRGASGAILFNTLGFFLALKTTDGSPVMLAAVSTLWSFLGVLVLPSLSRGIVFAADRYARQAGLSPEQLRQSILALDKLQDDEPDRLPIVETIFHPIPSAGRRLLALDADTPASGPGGWQLLRTMLYLSWASGGFLSRAVHCNIGKPELWVYLPGD